MSRLIRPPEGDFTREEHKWREMLSKVAALFLSGDAVLPGLTYAPTITAAGVMVISAVSGDRRYVPFGRLVFLNINITFETSSLASGDLYVTLPLTLPAKNTGQAFACMTNDGGEDGGFAWLSSTTQITARKKDRSNWGIGAGRGLSITGLYEAA